MNRSRVVMTLLLLTCCRPSAAFAQQNQPAPSSPQTTSPALPSDPAALLQLAWQVNGLHGPGVSPWHVHATWIEVDKKGEATDNGTWEEWWAGGNRYKISYTSGSYQQNLYVTDDGAFVTGSHDVPKWDFALVEEAVTGPVPDPQHTAHYTWREQRHKLGAIEIICAKSKYGAQYCFAPDSPVLRVYKGNTVVAEWSIDSMVRLQGRYLGRKIRVLQDGLPETDITLDHVENIATVVDSDFTPPRGAIPAAVVLVPRQTLASLPVGDPIEFSERISGVVLLDVTIRTDGSVADVAAASGPPILQQSFIKAVKTWRFKPYQIAGNPVGVRTRISIYAPGW